MAAFFAGLLPVKPNFTPYPNGLYRSAVGTEFKLSQGPVALSVVSPDGLCLRFWDQEDPPRKSKVIELRGQACTNRQFGAFDWSARYRVDRLSEVRLTSTTAGAQPIFLTRTEQR